MTSLYCFISSLTSQLQLGDLNFNLNNMVLGTTFRYTNDFV